MYIVNCYGFYMSQLFSSIILFLRIFSWFDKSVSNTLYEYVDVITLVLLTEMGFGYENTIEILLVSFLFTREALRESSYLNGYQAPYMARSQ